MEHIPLESTCPACGHTHNMATNMEGEGGPEPGDVTVCILCLHVLMFDDQLKYRYPTKEEEEKLKENAGLQRMLLLLREAKRKF